MARDTDIPTLTPNNRIYLYRLLSTELGCGKQTFITVVEEALATDRMTADDLGFESTRALLEALDEFVKLTVFKGGRIYATVIAQPEWDAALVATGADASEEAPKGGKPWKRKKADKTLKPVRPKRVKRPEPKPEPEVKVAVEAPEPSPVEDMPEQPIKVVEPEAPVAVPEPLVEPAISITVTYDPYSGSDEETVLASNPIVAPAASDVPREPETAPAAEPETAPEAAPAPAPQPVPAPQPADDRPSPEALASYPVDLSSEVYLASERIAELCELLPYGTDVFTLLAEDYARARKLEVLRGTRAKVTFPLRIEHADRTDPIEVTLKKRSGSGLDWELFDIR